MDKGNLEHRVQEWRKKRAEKLAMRLQIHSDKKRTISGLVLGITHDKTVQLPTPPLAKSVPDLRIPSGPSMRKSLSSGDVHQRRASFHPGAIKQDPRNHHSTQNYHQQELSYSPYYHHTHEYRGKNSFSEPRKSCAGQRFNRGYNKTAIGNTNWQDRTPSKSSGFGPNRNINKKVLSGKTAKTPHESAFKKTTNETKNNVPKSVHFHENVKFTESPKIDNTISIPELLVTAETEENLNGTFLIDDNNQATSTTCEASSALIEKTSSFEGNGPISVESIDVFGKSHPIDATNKLNGSIIGEENSVADHKPNPVVDVNQSGLLDSVQIVETIEVFTTEDSDIKNSTFEIIVEDNKICEAVKNQTFEVNEDNNQTLGINEDKNRTLERNEDKNKASEVTEANNEEKHLNNAEELRVKIEMITSEPKDEDQRENSENILQPVQDQSTGNKNGKPTSLKEEKTILQKEHIDKEMSEKLDNMYITPSRSARKSRVLLDSTNIVESSCVTLVEVKNKDDPREVLLTPVRRSTRKKSVVPGSQDLSEEKLKKVKVVPNPFLNA